MGRSGTVRKDRRTPCPACGLEVRPCNLERHLRSKHRGHKMIREIELRRVRDALRWAGR